MVNRVFEEPAGARDEAERLIDVGRYRLTDHAQRDHPELPEWDKVATVRHGGRDQLDKNREPEDGVYVCWATIHGTLCRGVYAIEETRYGPLLVIITAFPEEIA